MDGCYSLLAFQPTTLPTYMALFLMVGMGFHGGAYGYGLFSVIVVAVFDVLVFLMVLLFQFLTSKTIVNKVSF